MGQIVIFTCYLIIFINENEKLKKHKKTPEKIFSAFCPNFWKTHVLFKIDMTCKFSESEVKIRNCVD